MFDHTYSVAECASTENFPSRLFPYSNSLLPIYFVLVLKYASSHKFENLRYVNVL
jgi:hypothetical protein